MLAFFATNFSFSAQIPQKQRILRL